MNKDKVDDKKFINNGDSDSDNDQDLSGFKTTKKNKEERAKRMLELNQLKAEGKDNVKLSDAIRLPNRISKGMTIDPNTGTAKQ
jgi:hypothetical protein